jgi:hypothetical protein
MERIQPDNPRLQLGQCRALVASADLAKADNPLVGDQLEDRPQKVAGMNPRVVAELAGEWDRHRADAKIDDFHGNERTTRKKFPFRQISIDIYFI